jgi:hypothetical protein
MHLLLVELEAPLEFPQNPAIKSYPKQKEFD